MESCPRQCTVCPDAVDVAKGLAYASRKMMFGWFSSSTEKGRLYELVNASHKQLFLQVVREEVRVNNYMLSFLQAEYLRAES